MQAFNALNPLITIYFNKPILMFTKEKKSNLIEKAPLGSATLIGEGTALTGDVKSSNDLRIDGSVIGNVYCSAKIILGPAGYIEGNIESHNADINGRVVGNVQVKELLQLRGQSNLQGNIIAAKLQIDQTATFNGQCQMGAMPASVVKMTEPDVPKAKAQ
jgi:cytoskeletal protein CcmA (bactofilin family)